MLEELVKSQQVINIGANESVLLVINDNKILWPDFFANQCIRFRSLLAVRI